MLSLDPNGNPVQGLATRRIEAITADTEWTPEDNDSAFCVPEDCTYQVNDTGSAGTILAGSIRAIVKGQTYTFDTTMNIEVM